MKKLKARTFFSEDEGDRIRQAVERAEADTSGEIATMVVDHSDSYREAEILGALSFAGLLGLILAVAIHHVTIWSYIPLVILFFIPARYLFRRFPHLKLPFAGRRRVVEAVRERAVRAFFEKGYTKPGMRPVSSSSSPFLSERSGYLETRELTRKSPHSSGVPLPMSFPRVSGKTMLPRLSARL